MVERRGFDDHAGWLELVDGLGVPAFILDENGAMVASNASWVDEVGTEPGEAPWEWLEPLADETLPDARRELAAAIESRHPAEVDIHVHRTDGSVGALVCVLGAVEDTGGERRFLGLCWDATDRVRNEQRLAFMAGHDALTGLANRHSFEESLTRIVSKAERGTQAVVLMVDLDHLKTYNDALGHLEGDQALVNFAMLLRTHVRAADLSARIGGDEFAVLLEDADLPEAIEIAGRICDAAREEFVAGSREYGLGASIGVARVMPGLQPRAVLDRADCALYQAKESGRGRIVVWEDMQVQAR